MGRPEGLVRVCDRPDARAGVSDIPAVRELGVGHGRALRDHHRRCGYSAAEGCACEEAPYYRRDTREAVGAFGGDKGF